MEGAHHPFRCILKQGGKFGNIGVLDVAEGNASQRVVARFQGSRSLEIEFGLSHRVG